MELETCNSCLSLCVSHECLPSGGEALVSSGIIESLLQVLDWKVSEPSNITVSRALCVCVCVCVCVCMCLCATLLIKWMEMAFETYKAD